MPVSYVLSHIAEQDIDDLVTYIAQENKHAALDLVDALYDAFDKLAENPYLGHIREDLTKQPVRFWTFRWHYLIVYKPDKLLKIVRVLSGFRDISNLI